MRRIVEPELLDQLPHDDPGAVGSRRDLGRVNAVMGNHRWLCRSVASARKEKASKGAVIELGAGDGILSRRIAQSGSTVVALDIAPAPSESMPGVEWRQGDFFETLPTVAGDTLVACLILHHFESEALARLGELIEAGDIAAVCVVEPHRSKMALLQARMVGPLVNAVTRHDMAISVRAGFRCGELAPALDLDPRHWDIEDTATPLGGYRFRALRK